MNATWDLVDETARLYRATYAFGYGGSATAVLFGLGDDELALMSPPGGWLAPALFDAIPELGRVTALVAPNGFHRIGLPEARRRYPEAPVFAPRAALKRVGKVVDGPRALEGLGPLLPEGVELRELPGMKRPDTFLRVQAGQGPAWYLNDVVTNLQALPEGAMGLLLDAMGFREGLALNTFGCRWITKARPELAQWLLSELRNQPPALVLAGHGPVESRPQVLARLPGILQPLAGGS